MEISGGNTQSFSVWPNTQTAITSMFLLGNLACRATKAPLETTAIINVFRIASITKFAYDENYPKVFFDVLAFASLFFQGGAFIVIAIDGLSEIYNYHTTPSEEDIEHAYKVLSIPENKKNDKKFIEGEYLRTTQFLQKSFGNLPEAGKTGEVGKGLQKMISDAKKAYHILTQKGRRGDSL